jgi:TonB family protein
LEWESARSTVFSNLRAVLGGPKAPKIASGGQYFPGILVLPALPVRALVASVLWHIAVFYFPSPNWPRTGHQPQPAVPSIEITWYAPPSNLTPLVAPPPLGKRIAPSPANKQLPPRAPNAFHPQQTILSLPKQPTHPRQTLIQPEAPPLPPKILPPLPNIVLWSEPPLWRKPRLTFRPPSPAKLRPNPLPSRPPADVPVPAVPNEEKAMGELGIAASVLANSQPRLPVPPMSALVPQARPQQTASDATPAPDIGPGSDANLQRVIALSAAPAPPAPVIEVPPGNLQARIAISPEGAPPTLAGGTEGSSGAGSGAKTGPPEVSITGARTETSPAVAGLSDPPAGRAGVGLGKELLATPLPAKPVPRLVPPDPGRTRSVPAFDRLKPGAPPESILAPKRVYTLHVNMPNLASATGSWVLNFAELEENDPAAGNGILGPARDNDAVDLVGPVPLRKVDPRYPPALVSAHVQGEVVLYAIIRRDGVVDSIQLVRGVDPELNRNAMEALGRWKFRPAQRNGESVELEAVVRVPFRFVVPF